MDDDDILGGLEARIADESHAGESPQAENIVSASVEAPPLEASPLVIERGGTAMADALSHLSPDVALRVATVAVRFGIRENNDPFWGAIEVMQNSFECAKASGAAAAAAGASAEELARMLEKLPKAMLEGARLAGVDVTGELKTAVKEVTVAILQTGKLVAGGMSADLDHVKKVINDAAVIGADKIKTASGDLVGKLDAAVDLKKNEGADQWAKIAEKAAVDSAKTALGKIAVRGGLFTMLMLISGALIGGGTIWATRTITGDYLPAGVQMFRSPAGYDFIRVDPKRATIARAIACGADLCIPVVPSPSR
ncbi:MAG: hypothetical protein M0Z50_09310 [Planctomycetia bacterium]|nr:hypothetical protein [Planctomycetia bacterium]